MADEPKQEDANKKELAPLPEKASKSLTHFLPRNLEEAMSLATVLARSNLIPREFQGNASNVLVAVMHGAEIGLSAAQSLSSIMVLNGRASLWGDVLVGKVLASGEVEYQSDKWDPATKTATFTVKRKGWPEPTVRSFSMEDAKSAGLTGKDAYQKYPARMCFNRARAWAYRDTFADVLRGIGFREEMDDLGAIETTIVRPADNVPGADAAAQAREALRGNPAPEQPAAEPVKVHEAEIVDPNEAAERGVDPTAQPKQPTPAEIGMTPEAQAAGPEKPKAKGKAKRF